MSIFEYASACEKMFESNIFSERKTTFFYDLSIAEYCEGAKGVRDTFNEVVKSWLSNYEYFTEFVMCLNHKIWQHYQTKADLALVYDELWRKAESLYYETYKDDQQAMAYYYEITD